MTVLRAMEEHRKQLGARVLRLREQKRWTHEDLSHAAGVSVKTVSRIESGSVDSRRSTIRKVAKALGVKEQDILGPPPVLSANGDGASIEVLLTEVITRLDRIEAGQIPERARQALLKLADAADPEGRGRGKRTELPPGPADQGDEDPGAEGGVR